MEVEAIRRDGRTIKVELAMTALPRRGGCLFNGFLRDITEKLAKEEQYGQAQKMEAVGQLTGGIAHDFNNMLTVIIGSTEVLSAMAADKPELLEIAKTIDQAAERGADLTRRLLAFARKQPLQPSQIDINILLTNPRNCSGRRSARTSTSRCGCGTRRGLLSSILVSLARPWSTWPSTRGTPCPRVES